MIIGRLNVGRHIFLGFGLLVALSIAQAAFSIFQFGEVNYETRRAIALASNSQGVLAATHALETVRRAETHYRLDGDEESLKIRQLAVTRVSALLEDASRDMISGTQLKTYRDLITALRQHDESFARLIRQTDVVSSENRKLDEGGTTMSLAIVKLVGAARISEDLDAQDIASEVERALLVVRMNNWRFQALYDQRGPGLFSKSVVRARTALAAMANLRPREIRDMQAPLEAATDAYANEFDAIDRIK